MTTMTSAVAGAALTAQPSPHPSRRMAGLVLTVLACGTLTAMWALYLLHLRLPDEDAASHTPYWSLVFDPFVITVVAVILLPICTLGAIAARWLLWETNLSKSAPVVFVVTLAAGTFIGLYGLVAAPLTLAASIGTMAWCKARLNVLRVKQQDA